MLSVSFCNRSQAYFLLFLEQGSAKSLAKKFVLLAQNLCFKKSSAEIAGVWHWKSAILSTALRICQHEDIWPIRAWYQNLVSWNDSIKGMSPGSAAISPSPDHCEARFALRYFSYFCYLPFFPTVEPGPRLRHQMQSPLTCYVDEFTTNN